MALRLEVLSEHRKLLGESASIVFGVGGGSFGRASDNDWVLPDPQRYLSGHHGRIHFRQGAWYLEDLSTNGTYVNDSPLPVSRTGPYALRDGDLLRFGEYEVRAHIDAEEPAVSASSVIARGPSGTVVDRVVPVRVGGGDDLGASLNIEALVHADGASGYPAAESIDATEERLSRLRAAARARLEGGLPQPGNLRSSLQAFCRGAGIDPARLPPDADLALLHAAGQLMRELLLGLQDLVRLRAEFRNSYLVDETNDQPEGPSLSRLPYDEFLVRLLAGHHRRDLDALMQVREEVTAAARHESALAQALPQAFAAFIAHLSPAEIQSRFEAARERGGHASPWDYYAEIYPTLTQPGAGAVPHLYAEALAQAYLALLRRPDE